MYLKLAIFKQTYKVPKARFMTSLKTCFRQHYSIRELQPPVRIELTTPGLQDQGSNH